MGLSLLFRFQCAALNERVREPEEPVRRFCLCELEHSEQKPLKKYSDCLEVFMFYFMFTEIKEATCFFGFPLILKKHLRSYKALSPS